MSVFQLKDWWNVHLSEGEEFDIGSLDIGNVDNSPAGLDKIVVSSLSGALRIYLPNKATFRSKYDKI